MDIPIIHTIMITATTLMAPFPSIMVSVGFIVSMVVATSMVVITKLATGEEGINPSLLRSVDQENRIFIRWRLPDEMIKTLASVYIR